MKKIVLDENISDIFAVRMAISFLQENESVIFIQQDIIIFDDFFFKKVIESVKKEKDWDCLLFPKMSLKKDEWEIIQEPINPRKVSKYFCQLFDKVDDFQVLVLRPESLQILKEIEYQLSMGPVKRIIEYFEDKIVWSCILGLHYYKDEVYVLKEDLNTNEYFRRISW